MDIYSNDLTYNSEQNSFYIINNLLNNNKKVNKKGLLNTFLYNKYNISQNFYYTSDINNLLEHVKTKNTLKIIETFYYDKKSKLSLTYYKNKKKMTENYIKILQYYKYHNEVPRMFMDKLADIINNYYNKQRKINYIKFHKLINNKLPSEELNLLTETESELNSKDKLTKIRDSLLSFLPKDLKNQEPESRTVQELKINLENIFSKIKKKIIYNNFLKKNESKPNNLNDIFNFRCKDRKIDDNKFYKKKNLTKKGTILKNNKKSINSVNNNLKNYTSNNNDRQKKNNLNINNINNINIQININKNKNKDIFLKKNSEPVNNKIKNSLKIKKVSADKVKSKLNTVKQKKKSNLIKSIKINSHNNKDQNSKKKQMSLNFANGILKSNLLNIKNNSLKPKDKDSLLLDNKIFMSHDFNLIKFNNNSTKASKEYNNKQKFNESKYNKLNMIKEEVSNKFSKGNNKRINKNIPDFFSKKMSTPLSILENSKAIFKTKLKNKIK